MAKLINGNGNRAIYASQDADLIASLAGNVTCIANVGNKYAATIEDANTIGLADGVIITKEGRRIQLDAGDVDLFAIPTGSSGVTNYYIIGYKLVQQADSSQVAETFVQKMNSSSATIAEGTLRGGDNEVYVSVYRVTQVGFNIDSVDVLLPELLDNSAIKEDIEQIISDYVKKSGDAMNGPLNFASGTWNNIGNDCKFGDQDIAGGFAIQGINGETRIQMNTRNGSNSGQIVYKDGDYFSFGKPVRFEKGINIPSQTSTSTILNYILNSGSQFGCMGFTSVSDAPENTGEWAVIWFGSELRVSVYAVNYGIPQFIYARSIFNGNWLNSNWHKLPQMSVSGTTLNISL
jgi:hypothetical protein